MLIEVQFRLTLKSYAYSFTIEVKNKYRCVCVCVCVECNEDSKFHRKVKVYKKRKWTQQQLQKTRQLRRR